MKRAKPVWIGATKTLTRAEAVEEYVILRIRNDEINRLDYLLKEFHYRRMTLLPNSPFSTADLADMIRTCLIGWFASLTDKDDRAVYDPVPRFEPPRWPGSEQ